MKLFIGTWITHPTKTGAFAGVFDSGALWSAPKLGFVADVTSPKLRLHGVIACLECLRQPSQTVLVMDDDFIRNCVNGLIGHWSRNGWLTKDGNAVVNQPELEKLAQLMTVHGLSAAVPESQAEMDLLRSLTIMARDHSNQCAPRAWCGFSPGTTF